MIQLFASLRPTLRTPKPTTAPPWNLRAMPSNRLRASLRRKKSSISRWTLAANLIAERASYYPPREAVCLDGAQWIESQAVSIAIRAHSSLWRVWAFGVYLANPVTGPLVAGIGAFGGMLLLALGIRDLPLEARVKELQEAVDAARLSEADKSGRLEIMSGGVREAANQIESIALHLSDGFGEQKEAAERTAGSMTDITTSLQSIAHHVEALASSAEESSSSILEMTATNDEVAENMANLAASVRETVSSIEEMAYSIKEVARNVDALSLTAEETSSSMNQMDVSIDQVQSNANETARLSEEVATDAERGAEAILKIIVEINRIKETSSEAVAVISEPRFTN